MQFDDPRKWEILMNMENVWNLNEYIHTCERQGLKVHGSEFEYIQKVGFAVYGINKFPEKGTRDAYLAAMNGEDPIEIPNHQSDCKGCGGGQIR